jgi:hypothetical protein
MMAYMDGRSRDIVSKPRGGPDASRLDRRLQTNRLEYLDDVDDLKRKRRPLTRPRRTATVVRYLREVCPDGAW